MICLHSKRTVFAIMKLSDFIKDYRLKQTELAEVFGCKAPNVSKIVSGERNVTGLQIRQLIDRFGYDVIAKYAEPGEMPAPITAINTPTIAENSAPVNSGNGTQTVSTDAKLLALLAEKDKQIDRLISLLEQKYKQND